MELTLEILLDGIPWRVDLQKQADDEVRWKDTQNIWSISASDGVTTHWSTWGFSSPAVRHLKDNFDGPTVVSLIPGLFRAYRSRFRTTLKLSRPKIALLEEDLGAFFVPPQNEPLARVAWEIDELIVACALTAKSIEQYKAAGGAPIELLLSQPEEWMLAEPLLSKGDANGVRAFFQQYGALLDIGFITPDTVDSTIALIRRTIRLGAIALESAAPHVYTITSSSKSQLALWTPTDSEPSADVEEGVEDVPIIRPFDPSKVDVDFKPLTLDLIIRRMKENEIDLTPAFQRKDVWSQVAKSRLIESILIRIPLPAFYIDSTDDDRWVIVDGVQRLTAIKEFAIDQTLALRGLEFLSQHEDARFPDLPRDLRRRLEETQITVYLIRPGTPENVKFNIFNRINTGGLPLSPQEIRHALNQGPAADLLARLANEPDFLEATQRGIPSKRMGDREAVLRFLAFTLAGRRPTVETNFDLFLHDAMRKLNSMPNDQREDLAKRFLRAMKIATAVFGRNAFRRERVDERRGPVNKALFEAWSVALGSLSDEESLKIIDRHEHLIAYNQSLLEDPEFAIAISQGTADPRKIVLRFERVRNVIHEVLSDD